MKTEMTIGGIGPKLALISLPYVILSLVILYMNPTFFNLDLLDNQYMRFLAGFWMGLGLVFWGASAVTFLREFKKGKLITRGPYSLSRNTIYSSIIVFIIPAIAILYHSGLLLTIAVVLYINFKVSIHGESRVLSRLFGEEYEEYKKHVNELFPFPRVRSNRLTNYKESVG